MKLHKLPCKPYVRKYVAPDLSNHGVLKIKNRIVRTIRDKNAVTKYFEKSNDATSFIMVEMNCSSLYTLYALHSTLAREFRDKLFSVMAFAVFKGIPAREAARDFLLMYGITPDEYDMLMRAVYAESSRNKDEYANVMAVILNRTRKNGGSIIDTLMEKNQFQAVTGTANNPGPSSMFKQGPDAKSQAMIAEGASSLSGMGRITSNLDGFAGPSCALMFVKNNCGEKDIRIFS